MKRACVTAESWYRVCKTPCRLSGGTNVFRRSLSHIASLTLVTLALSAVWSTPAFAQRRRAGPVRPAVHSSVVVVGGYGYGYPRYFYDPWFQYGWPYPPYGYPYPYGRFGMIDELTSSIRLEVTPRDAEVFVDGYSAGVVDDFDGVFQRLRLRPGQHDLTLYLEGFRTVRQSLYVNPGSDQKIKYTLERLRAGEVAEAPPAPSPDSPNAAVNDQPEPQPAPRRPGPPVGPAGPGPGPGPGPAPRPRSSQNTAFGALSIRVQPGDADILVDGERWSAPAGQDRIVIELAEGRHRVEVRKPGFDGYGEDVLIRRGNTLTLNVSLLRGGEAGSDRR